MSRYKGSYTRYNTMFEFREKDVNKLVAQAIATAIESGEIISLKEEE